MQNTLIALTIALVSSSASAALAVQPVQTVDREAVRAFPEQLTPRIHDALMRVLAAEEELALLAYPFDEQGNMLSREELEWRMNDPESPLRQYLDRHERRFDTHGLEMEPIGLRDCILYDAAFDVAAELVFEHPDLEPSELMAMFERDFVEGEPIWTTDLAREFHSMFLETYELPGLGNGRALARLTWGVLQQEAWWRESGHDRGDMILEILSRGVESRLLADVADSSLASAIRPSMDPTRDGHGVCTPFLPIAMDVGYDRRHEIALEADLELITMLSEMEDPTGALDLDPLKVELLAGGGAKLTPNQLGHLRYWVPRKLAEVRDELYEGEYREELHAALRRSDSLEQRYLYWETLAQRTDFANFRVQMLEELEALVADQADFPGGERIAELLVIAEVRDLSDAERSELIGLQSRFSQSQDRFIGVLTGYLVDLGAIRHVDQLVETLRDDLAGVLAPIGADGIFASQRLESLLNEGWYRLATSDSYELDRILEQGLLGSEAGGMDLPEVGRDNLIWAATMNAGSMAMANLDRVVEDGTPRDVAVALLNPSWASEATYSRAMEDLLEDVWSPEVDQMTRMRIESYFTNSLAQRPVTEISKRVLLASIRDERWAAESRTSYWGRAWENPERFTDRLDLVRRFLSSQEIEDLKAQGVLPNELF